MIGCSGWWLAVALKSRRRAFDGSCDVHLTVPLLNPVLRLDFKFYMRLSMKNV